MHECDYNWKTFIEVYLEDYHVEPFHPGLGSFVTCDDLRWEFGRLVLVQTVGVNNGLAKPGSPTYERWHEAVLRLPQRRARRSTARSGSPTTRTSWSSGIRTCSWSQHADPARRRRRRINVVEFYYPEEIALFEREFVEAEQAAYMETAREDDEIALRMDAGRAALYERGDNEVGPYQSPMEDGMQHFHEFYRREMRCTRTRCLQ